jgi:hypothetical protein
VTLEEILAEIDEKYPNGLSSDSKVRKINNLQRKLFRTVVKRTVVKTIDLLAGVYEYDPEIAPAKIREVLVNGIRYQNRQLEGDGLSRFFYIVNDNIVLYPTPDEDKTDGLLLFHYQEPADLSSSSLEAIPDFDEDYHDALVYGVCRELAEKDLRFDIANGFGEQYNDTIGQYEIATQDTEPAQIQEEVWW